MAWVAVNKFRNEEVIFNDRPQRDNRGSWFIDDQVESEYFQDQGVELPKGTIKKLIGRDLTWQDNPVELSWSTK